MLIAHLMSSNDVVTIRNNVTTIMCLVTPAPGMTRRYNILYCYRLLLHNEEILISSLTIAMGYQCI